MDRCTEFAEGRYVILQDSSKPVELLGVQLDGTPVKVEITPASVSGDWVDKLGKYEDIHPDPEYVREIFERYMDLCR